MTKLPPRPCNFNGCPNLCRDGSGWCAKHKAYGEQKAKDNQRAYQKRRGSAASRGYGGEWRRVRLEQLKKQPLCEECLQVERIEIATTVHHIDHDQRNNNPSNLMSMCRKCHEKIHGRKRK